MGNHTVEFYDSIEDLPIARFQKFNKLLLIDAGVGSTIMDLDNHLHRMSKYVEKGQFDNFNKEIANLRQNFFLIMSGVLPKHRSFAALVHKIDDKTITDFSDDGLERTFEILSDLAEKDLSDTVSEVKKKLDLECSSYFPNIFESAVSKEYYSKLRDWTLAILEKIQAKEESDQDKISKKIDNLADELLLFTEPKVFTGKNNVEIEFDREFDSACMLIAHHLHVDPLNFTVLRFYNALNYVHETLKREQKQFKKIRK